MYGRTLRALTAEDEECLLNWDNYIQLDRLPHELGFTPEAYPEDIEAIKTMKRWMQEREEKERKKQEQRRRLQEKIRKRGGTLVDSTTTRSTNTNGTTTS
jgi:hypothetical protein